MNDILFNVWLVSRTKFNFNIVMYFCFRRNSQGFELSIYLETWENGPLCNVIFSFINLMSTVRVYLFIEQQYCLRVFGLAIGSLT